MLALRRARDCRHDPPIPFDASPDGGSAIADWIIGFRCPRPGVSAVGLNSTGRLLLGRPRSGNGNSLLPDRDSLFRSLGILSKSTVISPALSCNAIVHREPVLLV